MKKTYSLLLILILSVSYTFAQNTDTVRKPIFYLGAYIGYINNMHTANFNKIEGYPNCCPKFSEGSGNGVAVGVLFEYPLSDIFRLTARFGMASLTGELSRQQKIGNTEVRPADGFGNDDIKDAVSDYHLGSNLVIIGLEPGVSYYPIKNLNLNAGFRFGFLNGPTFDQSEKIISPDNIVFTETGTKARNESTAKELPNANSMQIHPFLGAGYDIPIFKTASITPEIRYYLGLTNVTDFSWSDIPDQYWKVNSLQLGAAVKFPLFSPEDKKYLEEYKYYRDTVVQQSLTITLAEVKLDKTEEVKTIDILDKNTELTTHNIHEHYILYQPREAKLTAALKVTGLNRDGSRQIDPAIVIEETETEEGFPLLPYVFFKESDADLKKTSMNFLSKSETAAFDPNKLEWETLEIYSNLLNIIGYRMTNSKSSITLTGTNNNFDKEKGNTELSKSRAQTVKDYLVNVWGISPGRINIQTRNLPSKPANNDKPEGKEENQRVEITSSDNNITNPLTLKDIVRSANPPKIEITPDLWSENGMDKWHISVSQKGQLLREYSGSGEGGTNVWDIEDHPIPSLEEPIAIKMNYTDKAGKSGDIEKNVKISQLTIKKKRFELKDDKRIERFSLILFDYDKANLTDAQERVLQEVKAKIKPNSRVIISGYADRTGEEQYNKELAAKRNAEVQKVLKVSDTQLEMQNIGSSELLYANSSPEGRSYCRTVKVLVETPVK